MIGMEEKYEAVIYFGISTDTEDMTGKIIQELPVTVGEASRAADASAARSRLMIGVLRCFVVASTVLGIGPAFPPAFPALVAPCPHPS